MQANHFVMKQLVLVTLIFFSGLLLKAQPVQFKLSNTASISYTGGNDTLLYPYTGGLNAPQFNAIDLDGDGIKDLLVFDRSGNKTLTYLFKLGKYVYAPSYESQFPPLYKWVIIKDYNCDGKDDIFTEVDYNVQPQKDKYISSNGIRVLKNVSTVAGKFVWQQDLNQLMDTGLGQLPPSNIALANADFSAVDDIDNDGDLDILQMPFGKNVLTYYQNLSKEMGYNCDSLKFIFRDECWGYMSYLVNSNAFYLNDNSACFRNYKTAKHNGTTISLFDADNDGDKDLIYGDVGFPGLVYLENGKTINSNKRDSVISQDTAFPKNSMPASMEIFPASFILDVDGDGKKDMLVAPNADKAFKNKDQIMFYKNTGTATVPVFTYQNNSFLGNETFDLGGGSIPVFCDIDNDNDQDLFVATQGEYTATANANDRIVFFRNTGSSTKASFVLADTNFLNINAGTQRIHRMVPTFGDLNGDGKQDLLIGDLNGKMHFYENTSAGNTISFSKKSSDYFTMYAGSSAAPQLVDLNKDGKLDVVVGRRDGTLAYFENKGSTTVPNFNATANIDSIGKFTVSEMVMSGGVPFYFPGYAVPHVCDLDKDGNFEVLVGSDMGRVFLFRNFEASANRTCDEIHNVFTDASTASNADMFFGPITSAASADLNGDGKPEVLIGNNRGGLRMYTAFVSGVISSVQEQTFNKNDWHVYPNPSKGQLYVETPKNMYKQPYEILDILGKKVQSGELEAYESLIQTSGLPSGVYFLRATDAFGNVFIAKFLQE